MQAQSALKTLPIERELERATWYMTEASLTDRIETLTWRLSKAQGDSIKLAKHLEHRIETLVQRQLNQHKMRHDVHGHTDSRLTFLCLDPIRH